MEVLSLRVRRPFVAFVVIISAFLMMFASVQGINHYFPYQPGLTETIQYIYAQESEVHPLPQTSYTLHITGTQIIQIISEVPNSQLVMKTFTQTVRDGRQVMDEAYCFQVDYITRHLLNGPRAYSGFGGHCQSQETRSVLPPIRMQGHHEKGTYTVAGMVMDEQIDAVKAHWRDGTETTTAVINNVFLFFRADKIEVEWVIGIDKNGHELGDTITYNRHITFSPLDYTAVQQVNLDGGIIVLGAYTFAGSQPQECLEVTYVTAQNAERFLTGKAAISGQRACVLITGSEKIAPTVSTTAAENKVVSGRILDENIKQVHIRWADGVEQTIPTLENEFFMVHRPEHSFAGSSMIDSIWGLDASGHVVKP
jgi:hypothetical protein